MNKIPVMRPRLPDLKQISPYLRKIDENRIYSNFGPLVSEFEERIACHLGLPRTNVVSAANGTLALQGALATSELDHSTAWEMPSFTFTATPAAGIQVNKLIRFRDIDEEWRINPSVDVEALVDVLPFGDNFESARLPRTLERLVIDGAASFHSLANVDLPAWVSTAGMLSHHATKVLSTGEGGTFFSNDTAWADRFRTWTNFGMNGSRLSESAGSNSKMSEYAGAVGLASLDEWEATQTIFLEMGRRALEITGKAGLEVSPAMRKGYATPYWIVRCKSVAETEKLTKSLASSSIEMRRWWGDGCASMPAYIGIKRVDLAKTQAIAQTTVGLPFWIDLPDQSWNRIEHALTNFS